ncbi:hypothetical protein [Anthocerotibacter panamensis]|uniref:hypothetical protein n=1 Tax=Anthocerotibacter panamensis TaxID=2857077 RepID=UPI001C4075EE|nr:hypothetical protein [Anthocerotibacter panamensis]
MLAADPLQKQTIDQIRKLIWLYFWLLIFEGTLRKWVVPGLATPLLIVRDPVVLVIYYLAYQRNLFPKDTFTTLFLGLGYLSLAAGLLAIVFMDTGSFPVVLYGMRTNFLHLPLIFLMPKVLTRDDIKKFGYWTLLATLLMAVVMIFQFYAPADAYINRTVGLGEGKLLDSAQGRIRPSGTFAFSTGPIAFLALAGGYFLYGALERKTYPNWLLAVSGFGLVSALAVSGSRGALGSMVVVLVALVAVYLAQPKILTRSYPLLGLILVIGVALSFSGFFSEGVSVLTERVENAGAAEATVGEGGTLGRVLDGYLGPFNTITQIPPLGIGLGMGTNAGAAILTGKAAFLLAEGEWGRILFESGPILGLSFILLRIALTVWLAWQSFRAAHRENILPLLLFGACALSLLNGQLGPPTILGFVVLGAGLCLSALQPDPT